jgi:hypothetical protein
MAASHSAQDLVRPGEALDLFYYDHETSKKQIWPTTVNTKYVQQFANLTGGSSVFTIPPNNGVQDVVISLAFNALTVGATSEGLALNRGWGYAAIKQVSFRYGGSSQYFLSGDQVLQNALRAQPSRETASDLLALGGAAAIEDASGTGLSGSANYANVVLVLPHATPSGVGKAHPFPSDCLTQQIQVTVELYPPSAIFSVLAGSTATVPSQYASATFQVQQVLFNNLGDSLARRVDLAENAYAFPAEFVQQKQVIPLLNTASSQSVVLTGFRSGEVKSIQCWLSRAGDLTGEMKNYFNWALPTSIEMSYAGDIYARFNGQSSTLWNLINGNKYPGAASISLTDGGATFTTASQVSTWVELPFAQTFLDEDSHHVLVHGKPITNGIVNLLVTTPSAQADWQLNVSYVYNTTLLFSQGTADYVF